MDTTQITIPKKEIAPGVFTTGGTATIPTINPISGQTNTITPESLAPTIPINIGNTPKPEPTTIDGDIAFYNQLQNQQTAQEQKLLAEKTSGASDLSKLLTDFTGQGAEQAQLEQNIINPIQGQLQDLTGQIGSQIAEYNALKTEFDQQSANIEAGAGRKGLTTGAVMGQQGAVERAKLAKLNSKASEIGLLQAQAQMVQGKLDLAQKQIDRAIDLKYKSIEQEINVKKFNLENLKESLTAEEKKRADSLTYALNKQAQRVAEQKENDKTIQTLKIKIIENGGSPSILDKVKTVDEALKLGASALKTPNNEIRELNGALYMIDKNTGKSKLIAGSGGGIGVGGKGTTITKPVSDAINTILGSGKFTKDQATAVRNAINSGEDPLVVIKNNAKNIMGQTEATALGKYETAKQAMTDLDNSLKQFYANGGQTDIFRGNYEKVINKLGQVNDPRLVDLAVQIQTNLQVYRNAVSGTAYSEQEGKDIASIFPGINKTEGLNQAIISGRQKAFDSTIDGTYKNVLGSNYDKLKNNQIGVLPKSGMSDRDYVEKVLVSKNIKYDDIVNATPQGQIPVIDNATGQTGYIPYLEFNNSKYTKI